MIDQLQEKKYMFCMLLEMFTGDGGGSEEAGSRDDYPTALCAGNQQAPNIAYSGKRMILAGRMDCL